MAGMLVKDPNKRIKLKDLLMHPWLLHDCPEVGKLRKQATRVQEFRFFSLPNPGSMRIYDDVKRRTEQVVARKPTA